MKVYLWMRWPDGDWNNSDVETTVKSCNQVNAGRIDESNVISSVQSTLKSVTQNII